MGKKRFLMYDFVEKFAARVEWGLVVDEDGQVHLVEANPERHVELASFPALEGEMNLNVPALAHGLLLLRNERELQCFDLRVTTSEPLSSYS